MSYILPISIDKYNIYDIFHNDNSELIIITPYLVNSYTIQLITDKNKINFNLYKCPHNHTFIYSGSGGLRKFSS